MIQLTENLCIRADQHQYILSTQYQDSAGRTKFKHPKYFYSLQGALDGAINTIIRRKIQSNIIQTLEEVKGELARLRQIIADSITGKAPLLESPRREIHPERWEPQESEKPALVDYFKDYIEGMEDCCGEDSEEAAEARELYQKVLYNPLSEVKGDIQDHFILMFEAVNDDPETYYSNYPECIRLINLTICPDPKEGAPD